MWQERADAARARGMAKESEVLGGKASDCRFAAVIERVFQGVPDDSA